MVYVEVYCKLCAKLSCFRFLSYVPVKILDSILELLGKEIGDTPAEIQSYISRPQVNRMLEVIQRCVIIAETALRDASVMEAGCKYRIDPDRPVKILLCTSKVLSIHPLILFMFQYYLAAEIRNLKL